MRRVSFLLAFMALTLAGPALAQDGAPLRPTTVISQPKPQVVVKPKAAPQISLIRPSVATSRYASAVDQASQCRAQCSEVHNVCAVDDGGPGGQCDSEWSRCNVRCSGTGYAFHSSAFKPSN
ncbi:MAG: hypothetical protein ACYDD1_17015 [Caulobacteraceae bacterium]